MKSILINCNISDNIRSSIEKLDYNIILIPSYSRLPLPVSAHADMLFYPMKCGKLLTYRDYYETNKEYFDRVLPSPVLSDIIPDNSYPNDIALNALRIGDILFCKKEYTEEIIKDFGTVVNVKQGYTRCSVCVMNRGNVITSDPGLIKIFSDNGINSYVIDNADIKIDGYNNGFIGGASFVDNNTVYFFGTPGYRNIELIKKACNACGCDFEFLSDDPLYDYGGAVISD